MARIVKDAKLQDRTKRRVLVGRGKPYYRAVEAGLHLGYRKPKGRRGASEVAGKWVVRHYDPADQTYSIRNLGAADDFSDADGVVILSFEQAQRKARQQFVDRAHKAAGVTGPITVANAVEAYFAALVAEGRTTRDANYRYEANIRPKLGHLKVEALNADTIKRWHRNLAAAPKRVRTKKGDKQVVRKINESDEDASRKRRATANRNFTVLKAALNMAFREGKIASDAAWRRVEPFKNVEVARVRYLSLAECKRLINACDLDFKPLVQAALMSGARYGQITKLKVADFNPDAGTITVTSRKGRGPIKTVYVVLTDEGISFFNRQCAGRASGENVFLKNDGTQWKDSHQKRPMEAASARAKIEPAANFHVTRHSYASHAVMNSVPLLVVAKNLGHSDTRMVEKYYGHLAPSYITDAIRKGAPRFGTAKPSKVVSISEARPTKRRAGARS